MAGMSHGQRDAQRSTGWTGRSRVQNTFSQSASGCTFLLSLGDARIMNQKFKLISSMKHNQRSSERACECCIPPSVHLNKGSTFQRRLIFPKSDTQVLRVPRQFALLIEERKKRHTCSAARARDASADAAASIGSALSLSAL